MPIEPKSEKPNQNKSTDSSEKGVDVVQLMVDSLPNKLTESQRKKVRQLLQENEATFSKGVYDILRTPLESTESIPEHIDQFGSHFGNIHSSIWR